MFSNTYISYMAKFTLLSILFCSLLSCHATKFGSPPEIESTIKDEYVIGIEDILQIHVWKQPSISVTVPVRSDGKISIPLINDIQAAGLTPDQLKDEIAKKLENFIEEPDVSVIVGAINSQKVSVSGNINSPGVYKIAGRIRLIELISIAGGLNEIAYPDRILIIRKENGVEKYYQINYEAILNGEDIKQNIFIYPGDSVIVP